MSSLVQPPLLSSSQLASMLGVSTSTIVRAVRSGRLRPAHVTPGGHPRFRVDEARQLVMTPKGSPRPALLTSTEVADRLGISRSTMARAVKAGRVKPSVITPGGHYRYAEDTLPAIAAGLGVRPPSVAKPAPAEPASRRSGWSRRPLTFNLVVRVLAVLAALVALGPFVALARGAAHALRQGFSEPAIGVAFSLAALFLGSIFFLYSIKNQRRTL